MSDIYREKILDHYNNPRNFGRLKDYTHHSKVENLSCGDKIELWLKVDENETIEKVGFEGEGCAISVAAMSLFGSSILGKRVDEVLVGTEDEIVDILGIKLGYTRKKCAGLSYQVVRRALKDGNNLNMDK